MAQEEGQNGGQFIQRGIRHRGRIRNQRRKREVDDYDTVPRRPNHPLQDRQVDNKRNLFKLFKDKGKNIRSIVPPVLTPFIPPGLLPPATSEVVTIPTPEPVLSSPPETTSTIETQPLITEQPTPALTTLTPLVPPAETTSQKTTTARPIFVPQFPPPIGFITTEIPGSGVITIKLPPQGTSPATTETLSPPGSPTSSQFTTIPSSSSRTTFITLTSSAIATRTTTSFGIPDATESPRSDSVESSPSSAGRTAGIAVGTILGVVLIIAPVYLWFRRRRRGQSAGTYDYGEKTLEKPTNPFLEPIENLGATIGGLFGRWGKPSSRGDSIPEVRQPEPTHQRAPRRFEETKHKPIPNITLTAVAEEDGSQTGSPRMERTKSASTRIVISRTTPGFFGRHQSPRSSFLAEPGGGQGRGGSSSAGDGASRSNTSYRDRNSAMSDVSTSWMTTVTQKTDGEFVPPTALRYPGAKRPPMPRQQGSGQGGGGENEQRGPPIPVPGPSKWLSPPSWRVMARRSLTRSRWSDDGRTRSSPPSDSDKSQGRGQPENGSRRYM